MYEPLQKIDGVCTHDLLHEARKQIYGHSYFISSEDQTGINRGSKSWINELSSLGHVPNNTEETATFEGHIQEFVRLLIDEELQKIDYKKYGIAKYSVQSIGSFPCDTKVGDIDEFDYLCKLQFDVLALKSYKVDSDTDEDCCVKDEIEKNFFKVVRKLRDRWAIDPLNPDMTFFCEEFISTFAKNKNSGGIATCELTSTPQIRLVYNHGPATCVLLNWICVHGHKHEVNIDITLATDITDGRIDHEIKERIYSFPSELHGLLSYTGTYTAVYLSNYHEWIISSCSFDIPLFDEIKKSIGLDIRPVFRTLKLLVHGILPGTTSRLNLATSLVTSHVLKSLLFEEVRCHLDERYWQGNEVVNRLIHVLDLLLASSYTLDGVTMWPVCNDFITGTGFLSKLTPLREKKFGANQSVYTSIVHLREHLCENYQEQHILRPALLFKMLRGLPNLIWRSLWQPRDQATTVRIPEGSILLKDQKGQLHPAKFSREIMMVPTPWNTEELLYFQIEQPSQVCPYKSHPVILWETKYLLEQYKDNKGVDITSVPSDLLHHVWGLVYGGTLIEEDIVTGEYRGKVRFLKKYFNRGNPAMFRSDMWRSYMQGSRIDPPCPEVMAFLANAAIEDLETILLSDYRRLRRGDLWRRLEQEEQQEVLRWLSRCSYYGYKPPSLVYQVLHHILIK